MRNPILGAYGIQVRWNKTAKSGERQWVLDGVSFELFPGEVTALFGPNGSGKSTLLKVVSGVLRLPSTNSLGVVRYQGEFLMSFPTFLRARKVVYVSPDLRTEFPMTAQEVVSLGRICYSLGRSEELVSLSHAQSHQQKIQWAMEKCRCWALKDRWVDSLSGGEKQLVALARALAQGDRVLLLDEALSRMDLNHQAEIGKLLRELAGQGWAVLLVSHDLNLGSEWADRGIILKDGRVLCHGPIHDVLTQERIGMLYPDSSLVVGKSPTTGAPKVFFQ